MTAHTNILVVAEHDHGTLKGATLNSVTAAMQCGGEVHILVAGHNAQAAAQAAAGVQGVAKVLHADAPQLAEQLAENVAAQVLALARSYSHILFPAPSRSTELLPPGVLVVMLDGAITDRLLEIAHAARSAGRCPLRSWPRKRQVARAFRTWAGRRAFEIPRFLFGCAAFVVGVFGIAPGDCGDNGGRSGT